MPFQNIVRWLLQILDIRQNWFCNVWLSIMSVSFWHPI
jgi:hypothetical protein